VLDKAPIQLRTEGGTSKGGGKKREIVQRLKGAFAVMISYNIGVNA